MTLKQSYDIPSLPPMGADFESRAILKATNTANRKLAELKGTARALPNQGILIDMLWLTESGASSSIENIVTTRDELFQTASLSYDTLTPAQKEVAHYRQTLRCGFEALHKDNLITNNHLIEMYRILKKNNGGFRNTPGAVLKNYQTGATMYVPPQHPDEILEHMKHLEHFINDHSPSELDPLVKMALIHHQFESIHPFPDCNGRIGRILNILYLVKTGLLEIPILYLSGYINRTRHDYYRLLQEVRLNNVWEEWVIYVLAGIAETAQTTLNTVNGFRSLMQEYKHKMRSKHPSIYSQDLLNHIFHYPYTRIEFAVTELKKSRPTVTKYLNELAASSLLQRQKSGRYVYYMNAPLLEILAGLDKPPDQADQRA